MAFMTKVCLFIYFSPLFSKKLYIYKAKRTIARGNQILAYVLVNKYGHRHSGGYGAGPRIYGEISTAIPSKEIILIITIVIKNIVLGLLFNFIPVK